MTAPDFTPAEFRDRIAQQLGAKEAAHTLSQTVISQWLCQEGDKITPEMRLADAAPELLEACKIALHVIEMTGWTARQQELLEAITRAEGRQS